MPACLYIVATPIGHLDDITLRALEVLKAVHCIAAEDTRHSAKLMRHFGIDTPMVSYHDHSPAAHTERLLRIFGRQIGGIGIRCGDSPDF